MPKSIETMTDNTQWNITAEMLEQIPYLKIEIRYLRNEIAEISKTSGSDDLCKGAKELMSILQIREKRCVLEYNSCARFIKSISNERMQTAFVNRYVRGLTWEQSGEKIGMSAVACKQSVYRYLKKINEQREG